MSKHTQEFHNALERVGVIAEGFENDIEPSGLVLFAVEKKLTEREAQLALLVLQEACGCVLAEEQEINIPETYDIHEHGKTAAIAIVDDNLFQAAYFLAYNLRHGGRNDLFGKIVRYSATISMISDFLSADTENSLSDLKGATIGPFQILL